MNVFKEYFYWTYWYIKKIKFNKDNDIEKAKSAYLLLSALQGTNIMTILILMKAYLNIVIPNNVAIYGSILLALILFTINHYYLYTRREKIIKQYEQASPERRRRGKLFYLLYIVLTNFIFFYLAKVLIYKS